MLTDMGKKFFTVLIAFFMSLFLPSCASIDGENQEEIMETPSADLNPAADDNEPLTKFLREERYDEALKLALREKIFGVANYIAECVMETEELIDFVHKNYPEPVPASQQNEAPDGALLENSDDTVNEIRYTLARRLMRENKPLQAKEFFPQELLPTFKRYVEAIQKGYDFNASNEARAKGFWDAAMIVRSDGDALFSLFSIPEYIAEKKFASEDERQRVESRELFDPVIAIRYRAAKLAEYAASLLPCDNERTARILFTAGVWLKARSPKAADDFYRLLVIRCPKTKVGKRCIELRWFPSEVPWTREQVWEGVPAVSE